MHQKIIALHKSLIKHKENVFRFLFDPDIPYDNNASYHNFSVIETIAHSPLNYCMVA